MLHICKGRLLVINNNAASYLEGKLIYFNCEILNLQSSQTQVASEKPSIYLGSDAQCQIWLVGVVPISSCRNRKELKIQQVAETGGGDGVGGGS